MALLVENSFVRGRKDAGFLPMRAALGGTMIYHGLSKLKEEENRQEAGQMFEQIGIRPGRPLAVATGIAEVFAGVSAVLGFLTRPAALAVLVTQGVAIAKVHAKKGFDVAGRIRIQPGADGDRVGTLLCRTGSLLGARAARAPGGGSRPETRPP